MKPWPTTAVCALWLFSSVAAAQIQDSDDVQAEAQAEFTVVPALVRPVNGKYPDTHLVLFRKGCGDSAPALKLQDGDFSIQLSGAGYQSSNVQHDSCTVSFDVTSTSTQHGSVIAQVFTKDKNPVGKAFLHFADPMAGPIPDKPQVDVLWAPIGHKVCKLAFGRSVASNFICIAVKVGNNSGYQLQIAGVGFETPNAFSEKPVKTPNSSYAITRAVAQEGATVSGRSFVVHTVESLGLLMTSATPYFHNPVHKANYSTLTSIIDGPIQAALSSIWPELSLPQMNNLDDQSLRDGKLIPNNTQITTVVFLDRGSVNLDYKPACDHAFRAYDPYGVADPQDTSKKLASFPRMKSSDVKVLINNADPAAGNGYLNCVNGGNSGALKEALGNLVIVGDFIEYLQRIVVDQNVVSQELPSVAHVEISEVGDTAATLNGTNLDKMPDTIKIAAGHTVATATRDDKASSSVKAIYNLDKVLPSNIPFTIESAALLIAPTGIVKNSTPNISQAPTLSGTTLQLTGTHLDALPPVLTINLPVGNDTPVDANWQSEGSSSTAATYKLVHAATKSGTFTISTKDGTKIEGTTSGTVTIPPPANPPQP